MENDGKRRKEKVARETKRERERAKKRERRVVNQTNEVGFALARRVGNPGFEDFVTSPIFIILI